MVCSRDAATSAVKQHTNQSVVISPSTCKSANRQYSSSPAISTSSSTSTSLAPSTPHIPQVMSVPTAVSVPSAPNQPPSSYAFPKTTVGGSSSSQSFQSEWPKQFTWFHYCEFTDSAFCWHCMQAATSNQLKSSKRDQAFISCGYRNWKNATTAFRKHKK